MRQALHAYVAVLLALLVALSVAGCGSAGSSLQVQPQPAPTANASTRMSLPILDAWWDSASAGLRVEYGVPGAAWQGPSLYNDGVYSGAAACARKGIALLTAASGAVSLVKLPQGVPQIVAPARIPKAQIVFSPSCAAALMYGSGGGSALLVQGLLTAPRSTTLTLPGNSVAVAVSDSGAILASVPQPDGSAAIQLIASGGANCQSVAVVSKFGGMTFMPGSDAALFADAGSNTLTESSGACGKTSLVQIAGAADGISQPVAVGISADGRTAAVANGVGSNIVRVDLSHQLPSVLAPCQCSPAELKPLGNRAGFRLNEPGSGVVWAFDGDSAKPRTVFLPAAQPVIAVGGARP